jgi:dolichol-phosphate mannosyltransferase
MRPERASQKGEAGARWHRFTLWIGAAVLLIVCGRVLLAPRANGVYLIFANAGLSWREGEPLYPGVARPGVPDQFRYSPPIAALFAPFSLLPDPLGGCLWRFLNAAVYVAAFAWWRRAAAPGGDRLSPRALAALWWLLLPLSVGSLNSGQSNPLVTGLLLAAVAGVARQRWNLAAACITVAFLFKGYPLAVGLLLAAVYPRQFGPRLALALLAGLALPFVLQRPDYVAQMYRGWAAALGADDRTDGPLSHSYRDLWLLIRLSGLPVSRGFYFGVQLAAAAGAAALCIAGRATGWPQRQLLTALLSLGICWMLLCGPATESNTYILLAPVLAWAVVEAWTSPDTARTRHLPAVCYGVLALSQAACWFPAGKQLHTLGAQPLTALLLTGGLVSGYIRELARRGAYRPDGQSAPAGEFGPKPRSGEMARDRRKLSVVCPAFNEEEVLPHFHRELCAVLATLEADYDIEVIYVDDGSRDGTLAVLRELAERDARVRYLSLSRNFGHQAALTAGIEDARGDAVITMDSDLQHPPELLPVLLEKWRAGYEVVLTIREEDPRLGLVKRTTSKLFYRVMRLLSSTEVRMAAADYRLMSRKAVDGLLQLRETHRFLRGMVQWLGFPSAEVPYRPAGRRAGVSKYSMRRMLKLAGDGLLSFSRMPLRIATILGLAATGFGLLTSLYLAGCWLFGGEAAGGGVLLASLYLLGGCILCALGLVGEYVGRIYEQVKGRPLYVLKERSAEPAAGEARHPRRDAA